MGVMPFLAACHACVLMLYCIGTIVCYDCSFEWQIKFSLSLFCWLQCVVCGLACTSRALKLEQSFCNDRSIHLFNHVTVCVCVSVTAVANGCRQTLQVLKLNYCKQITVDCLLRLARTCRRSVTCQSVTILSFSFSFGYCWNSNRSFDYSSN